MSYTGVEHNPHGRVWAVRNSAELLWIVGSRDCAAGSMVQICVLGGGGLTEEHTPNPEQIGYGKGLGKGT